MNARHLLKLDALQTITDEQVEATIRPWLLADLGDAERPSAPPRG